MKWEISQLNVNVTDVKQIAAIPSVITPRRWAGSSKITMSVRVVIEAKIDSNIGPP